MAYLQELLQTQEQYIAQQQYYSTVNMGLRSNEAYAQYFPTWEVTTPQYQTPTAWSLSQLGYRTNEVAYACISLKMKSISEPRVRIWDKVEQEFIDDSKNEEFFRFMEQPCPDITETDFHAANQMYLDVAGVLAWEKDMSNGGDLLSLWPMMPQYCSYKRGQGMLLRAIQYQPYTGMMPLEIARKRMLVLMYPDPNYFGLKPLSPTAVMADIIKVDNDMTTMLETFIQNGAFISGVLTSEQVINAEDARFAKERFQETHGGPNRAGEIVVIGKGLKFERSGQTFREMVFPEVDARSETRICMGYSVPPILVSAKSGMDRATYSNYEQARKAWYEEYVTSQWKFLAERYTKDILSHFDTDTNHILKFDTKDVKALQEDRTNQWKRADEGYKARIITRNEARVEKGLDQLEDEVLGNEYYQTAMTQMSTSVEDNLDTPNADGSSPLAKGEADTLQPESDVEVTGQQLVKVKENEDEEEKHFRSFAKRRLKENKPNDIPEFEFKYLDQNKQRKLLSEYGVPDPDAEMVLKALLVVIEQLNKPQDISVKALLPELPAPIVNIENNIENKEPVVNVTNEVKATPIENKIEVNVPRVKRTVEHQRVMRDTAYNIQGTVSENEYEYEDDE